MFFPTIIHLLAVVVCAGSNWESLLNLGLQSYKRLSNRGTKLVK